MNMSKTRGTRPLTFLERARRAGIRARLIDACALALAMAVLTIAVYLTIRWGGL